MIIMVLAEITENKCVKRLKYHLLNWKIWPILCDNLETAQGV